MLGALSACSKLGAEDNGTKSGSPEAIHSRGEIPTDQEAPPIGKESLYQKLYALGDSNPQSEEASRQVRIELLALANEEGLSLPGLIAGNIDDLMPDPSDQGQGFRIAWLCNGHRDEMIELICQLPAGPLKNQIVSMYGGNFVESNDLDAIRESYEGVPPGHSRGVLASLGSRAAYLSPEPESVLDWINSLEYPEEKRIAIDEVGSIFKQGLGKPADRGLFLKELQEIAKANGLRPPSGKLGQRLAPLNPPAAEEETTR